jgi:hypothetical protein
MLQASPAHCLRLSLVAPSGSGKSSTAAFMLERAAAHGLTARTVKLAQPLYELQKRYYDVAGIDIAEDAQNQVLMQAIATQLRSLRPDALARDFLRRLHAEPADVVINDDLRDMETDLPVLRREGFVTVRISADPDIIERRLNARCDLRTARKSHLDVAVLAETPDHVLVNNGSDLDAYRSRVHCFIDLLLRERMKIAARDARLDLCAGAA